MRADRLLSILMILQARGKTGVGQLADELEVSRRTIHRDIDALGASGVPVYFERGRNGGVSLLEGYRTNLTGLTTDELKALFILGITASLDELGMSNSIKTALRKLSASLPADRRHEEKDVRQRIHIDWTGTMPETHAGPAMDDIYTAVWENRKIHLRYLVAYSSRVKKEFERTVKPYGLVAKAGEWYLVCDDDIRLRVYPLSSVLESRITGEEFTRPPDFDLGGFWTEWRLKQKGLHPKFQVSVRISPRFVSYLSFNLDPDFIKVIARREGTDEKGYMRAELLFESFEDARTFLLGMGNSIEVLEPEALRLSIIDFAAQITGMYGSSG